MKNVLFLMLRSAVVVLLFVTQVAFGQGPAAEIPPDPGPSQPSSADPQGAPPPWVIPHFRLLREEEDFSYLANPQNRGHDMFDPLKYISLRNRDNWYLTIGADVREWFEW